MVAWLEVQGTVDLVAAIAKGSDESRGYEPHIGVDCAKLARQVRHSGRPTIGLLPTGRVIDDGRDTSLYAFACELAFAIGVLTHTLSVILDPEQASGVPPADQRSTFYAHLPAPNVAVLVPGMRAPAGARFEMIRLLTQWIEPMRDTIGQVLVDLRGCRLPGELLGATHLLDGIMVVGKSGRVDERDLDRSTRMVPPELYLGVVLTAEAK
ncbi:MAG: hypothetical protein U0414_41350 [Polyangiaceae bacterium]